MVYHRAKDVDFTLADLPVLPRPEQVLMTTPVHFDVQYVINPHMQQHVGNINRQQAFRQWDALRDAYAQLNFPIHAVPGAEGLPDMVFCANQTLPYYSPYSHERGIVLSRMQAEQRQDEVPRFTSFFESQNYAIQRFPDDQPGDFEGMGDAIWHPGRFLLWGGYGFRTAIEAYEHLSHLLNVQVLAIRLEDPDFYHLDTCFSVLDEQTVLIYPGAFQPDGLGLVHHFFPRILEAPEQEARHLFACNAHCPDGRHVLIQQGCSETVLLLRDAGFKPVEVDTREFLKAGGSIFCMKQMFW
jgi:N-dimethylarginine dimethylaminohydrolase